MNLDEFGNDFDKLDAQSSESAFAKMSAEEHSEFQAYIDWRDQQNEIKQYEKQYENPS